MLVFLMVPLHPTDECLLPIGGGSIWICGHPTLEVGMEGIEVPPRALLTQMDNRLFGHEAARSFVGQPRYGGPKQRRHIDQFIFFAA